VGEATAKDRREKQKNIKNSAFRLAPQCLLVLFTLKSGK
jgi:hypothetical protein